MNIKKVKIGVLSTSSMGLRNIIPEITSKDSDFILSGIASRDFNNPKMLNLATGCIAYGSYEELIEDSLIQAVYIPLPNSLHYKFVKMALQQGKHVLVEKPMACSFKEAKELVKIASNKNLVLLENFQFRFHSQLQIICDYVKKDIFGELRSIRISLGFPPFLNKNNIRYNEALGGGAFLDAGVYALKIAPYFMGDDISIVQAKVKFDENKKIDIWGSGVISQDNGPLTCHFAFGFDNAYQCSLELWGSKGKLHTDRIFTAPKDYTPRITMATMNGVEEIILEKDNHFRNILNYFYGLINEIYPKDYEYAENLIQSKLISQYKLLMKKK